MSKMKNLIEDFERLQGHAAEVSGALEKASNANPQDAIIILAMVSAFVISTQRTEGTSVEKARESLFKVITTITDAHERAEDRRRGV